MDPHAARRSAQRRRSTMLKLLLENRDEEVDASTFEPEWGEGEDYRTLLNPPECVDVTLALFYQMDEADVLAEEALPAPVLERERVPKPPSGTDVDMKEILIRLVQAQARKDPAGISQKDATVAIADVPPVADDGVAKTDAKLLAWIAVVKGTYLRDAKFFTTEFAFNLTRSLFAASPEMEGTWDQAVHSDARVVSLRE